MWLRYTMLAACLSLAGAQSASEAIVNNLETAKWTHDKDSDSVMLRMDEKSGGMDLLVRFPAGHVIPAHFHDSNERIVVVEGQLTLHQDNGDAAINAGGFAFLPAHEVQRLRCSSKTPCTFYLLWDGNPASHPAK